MAINYQTNKWWKVFYYLGTGTVLSFIFMTVGRGAWLVSCILVLLFLRYGVNCARVKQWLLKGIIIVISFCVTFPICFGLARYMPPLRHHPVWFDGEYSENKVHSWDPWDSEKYTDMDEFLEIAIGRIIKSLKEVSEASPLLLKVQAESRFEPVLTKEEGYNGYIVRSTIYKYFAKQLNLWGHKEEEIGFQLVENYWVGHAHNIYLQMGTQFGIFVMVAFALFLVGQFLCLRYERQEIMNENVLVMLLWVAILMIFGLFEFCWGAGNLSLTLLFLSSRYVICKK